MKKLNKKGFTIVELVIVIAVIAILAAVLIPTYTSVVEKANQSKALQEVKAAYTVYLADALTDDDTTPVEKLYVAYKINDKTYYVQVENGEAKIVDSEPTGYTKMEIKTNKENDKTLATVASSSNGGSNEGSKS